MADGTSAYETQADTEKWLAHWCFPSNNELGNLRPPSTAALANRLKMRVEMEKIHATNLTVFNH